jgi:parvulin-like peptidyl-prolyl isomerase
MRVTILSKLALCALLSFGALGCVKQKKPEQNPAIDISTIKEIFNNPIPTPGQADPNKAMLSVNGKKITQGQIMNQANMIAAAAGQHLSREQIMQRSGQIVQRAKDTLIINALLESEVEKEGITISEEEWTAHLDKIREDLPEGRKLEDQLSNAKVEMADFRKSQESRMKIDKLVKIKVPPSAEPTVEEARTFYDENPKQFVIPEHIEARLIGIPKNRADTPDVIAQNLATSEEVLEQLKAGGDFEALLEKHSQLPGKTTGGEVKVYRGSTGSEQLEEMLFGLQTNSYSEVVNAPSGFFIYRIDGKVPAATRDFDGAKDTILNAMKKRREQDAAAAYLKKLQDSAEVVDLVEPQKRAAAPAPDKPAPPAPEEK